MLLISAHLLTFRCGRGFRWSRALPLLAVMAVLAGCGTVDRVKTSLNAEDGPPDEAPLNYASIPDAVPVDEPLHPTANRRRVGQGRYVVDDVDLGPFSQRGWATWYGRKYAGHATVSGERFDPLAMTAAHQRLPIPSYARVINLRSGKSVLVRINDRGPAESKGVIALSYAAAAKLGLNTPEGGEVDIERLTADDIAKLGRGVPADLAPRPSVAAAPVAPEVAPIPAPVPVPAPLPAPASAAVAPSAQPSSMAAPLAAPVPPPAPSPIPAPAAAPIIAPAPKAAVPAPNPARPPAAASASPAEPVDSAAVLALTPDVAAIPSPWTPPPPTPSVAAPGLFSSVEGTLAPTPGLPGRRKEVPAPVVPASSQAEAIKAQVPQAGATKTSTPKAAASPVAAQIPGRWSVQVGTFAVAETAESVRRSVADKLAVGAPELSEPDRTPRVELRGTRHYVLVGDSADRADIDALAERVKAALRQDVVVLRR